MSKFRIFEKSPIFKKSNLTFKNFFKNRKKNILNFLFCHLVEYSLRFPKWVYLSKSFKKFRSYIFICKSSHIFSIADLGLLSQSYASMCTGVLALAWWLAHPLHTRKAPGSIPGMVTESADGTLHMTCPLLDSGINEYIQAV